MGDLIRRENLMGLPVLSNYTGEQLGYIINRWDCLFYPTIQVNS
ncbi:hypothetical protein [Xylanivirga thermophila]